MFGIFRFVGRLAGKVNLLCEHSKGIAASSICCHQVSIHYKTKHLGRRKFELNKSTGNDILSRRSAINLFYQP